jgi:hypothetical protein
VRHCAPRRARQALTWRTHRPDRDDPDDPGQAPGDGHDRFDVGADGPRHGRPREALREDEALVFDWHRVAICCAVAGEVSLRRDSGERVAALPSFRRLEGDVAIYASRVAYPHLANRDVTIDCRRMVGRRRFVSASIHRSWVRFRPVCDEE